MMAPKLQKNYTFLAAVSTGLAGLALILPVGPPWSSAVGLLYLGFTSWFLSGAFAEEAAPENRWLLGFLATISGWSLFGGVVYHLIGLTKLPLLLVALLVAAAGWAGWHWRRRSAKLAGWTPDDAAPAPAESAGRPNRLAQLGGWLLAGLTLALTGYGWQLLAGAATGESIRSPWDVVPQAFLVVVFLAVLAAFGLALSGHIGRAAAWPLAALSLLALAVAVLVYQVGYGFDPFIHQATERVILASGAITPKPFYYAGQYALITALAHLTGSDLVLLDRWLVPVGFALLLPLAAWSLRRTFRWPPAAAITAAGALLLLPLTPFISSTPQGWANLMALMTLFSLLVTETARERPLTWLPGLFAGAAIITHPLTGLPLLVLMAAWWLLARPGRRPSSPSKISWSRLLGGLALGALGSLVLPLAFIVNAQLSGNQVSWDSQLLGSAGQVITELRASPAEAARRYLPALDLAYFWEQSRAWVFWLLGLAGLGWLLTRRRLAWPLAVGLIAVVGNWLLMKTAVSLQFLIEYERADYANRLADLALYFLAPLAAISIGLIINRLRQPNRPIVRLTAVLLLAALTTASVYLAYPRRDKYEASRGWSTSAADWQTVAEIDRDAAGEPYVVLANQSVAAAAIGRIGFANYYPSLDAAYPGEVYFYPVPTGGPLYARFLEMNGRYGDEAVAEAAMRLTGVNLVYYVVNDYWWEARQLIAGAKQAAEGHWSVADTNFVFRYRR
jgi:F0F1-type ATP synthase membrane subunit c/vacuolar-type H+-ATPase subunit K